MSYFGVKPVRSKFSGIILAEKLEHTTFKQQNLSGKNFTWKYNRKLRSSGWKTLIVGWLRVVQDWKRGLDQLCNGDVEWTELIRWHCLGAES